MQENVPAEIKPEDYDVYTDQFTKPWNAHLIRRICEEVKDLNITRCNLLDIGTGTARTLIEMSEVDLLKDIKFIGVDFFEDMVKQAQKNVKQYHLENRISIQKGDVHQLNFLDDFFEIIIGRSVIHHWINPVNAYQELFRVLKPGGVIIIHEPCKDPNPKALTYFNQQRGLMGIHGMNIEKKYTVHEVEEQLCEAKIKQFSQVIKGEGICGIGFELFIKKSSP